MVADSDNINLMGCKTKSEMIPAATRSLPLPFPGSAAILAALSGRDTRVPREERLPID